MEHEIIINQYINGELSGAALEEFEAQLKKNESLQKEVQFHRQIDKALCVNEEVENNSKLNSILSQMGKTHIQNENEQVLKPIEGNERKEIIDNSETFNENKWKTRRKISFALLAAAAAFLLFMFLPSLQNQSNSQIADNFFQLYQLNDKFLGKESSADLLQKANENYAEGNWKEAISQFNTYRLQNPKALEVLLNTGCAQFKLAKFDAAIENFTQILTANNSVIYQPIAHWYLALSHLKKDDKLNAMKHLKIIQKDQDYFEEAQQLLKLL